MKNKTNIILLSGLAISLTILAGCNQTISNNNSSKPNPNTQNFTANFADNDNDGLSNEVETKIGTDPNQADTDQDGYTDGQEVTSGYNPLQKPATQQNKLNSNQPTSNIPAYGGTGYNYNPNNSYTYDQNNYYSENNYNGYNGYYYDYNNEYESPSDTGSAGNENFYDIMTDQGNYINPQTGETEKMDTSGGENIWQDSYGNYTQSDDPYYDPSYSDPSAGWEQMQSTSDEYAGYGYDNYDYYASTDY